ncbi:hypothetical protein PGB90_008561 [Kerria lacca]
MSGLTAMQNYCRLHAVITIRLNASTTRLVNLPAQNPYWYSEIPPSASRWVVRQPTIILSKNLLASSNKQIGQ